MKILLIADVPRWAWDRNADALIKYLPQYELSKGYFRHFRRLDFTKYDHVHSMGWLPARGMAPKLSGAVCSHNFELRNEGGETAFPQFMALTANSPFLYEKVKPYNEHLFYAPNGVHEDLFLPCFKERDKKFVVGWVGQETSGGLTMAECGRIDIKGYQAVLLPLIERMKKYPDIEFKLCTNNHKNAVSHEEMPKFYKDVDCQICTSLAEGTPNPMFEAASCGKALISTNVGAISECITNAGNGFLIDAYKSRADLPSVIDQFETLILKLKNDRDLCEEMGKKSRETIEKNWTWKERAKQWIPLFEYVRGLKG